MSTRSSHLLIAMILLVAACQSGSGPKCELAGGTQLAPPEVTPTGSLAPTPQDTPAVMSTWPKFRADVANSGRATVDLTGSRGLGATLLFDGYCKAAGSTTLGLCTVDNVVRCTTNQVCTRIGTTGTTPLVGLSGDVETIYTASSDGNIYVLPPPTPGPSPTPPPMPIQVQAPLVGSPLLGADGTIFVPSNTLLTQFNPDGTTRNAGNLVGFPAASPNIWEGDGTIFIATQAGSLAGVCPNGISRFALPVPPTQGTAIVVQDPRNPQQFNPIIVVAGNSGQVRSYNIDGNQDWSFFASATVNASVLVDLTTNIVYVADSAGHVFAISLATGLPDPQFVTLSVGAGITASPALGRDSGVDVQKLYVADQSGMLYALNRATGDVCWTFDAGGPINSSPAVATGGDHDVIVAGADVYQVLNGQGAPVLVGGKVFAVDDDDTCDGRPREAKWTVIPGEDQDVPLGFSIGTSSPSIGPAGTVYIGRSGTRLATGNDCCPTGGCPSDTACTVNDGGALYAIDP
jgi:outer membrane protein assembly factor BamB